MSYKSEFPDYVGDFKCPVGFKDYSWHNDIMPHVERELEYNGKPVVIKIWQDYEDPDDREYPDGKRYAFSIVQDEDDIVEEFTTDSWREIESYIANIDEILKKVIKESDRSKVNLMVNKILEGKSVRSVLEDQSIGLKKEVEDSFEKIIADCNGCVSLLKSIDQKNNEFFKGLDGKAKLEFVKKFVSEVEKWKMAIILVEYDPEKDIEKTRVRKVDV